MCETKSLNKTFDGLAETVMSVLSVEFSDVFRAEAGSAGLAIVGIGTI